MSDSMKTHGLVGWCDLMTDDVDKARDFYTGIFGWSTEVTDMGMGPYTAFMAGDRPVGGVMAKPPEAAGAPTAWTIYVTVDDVDESVAKVEAAGGTVLHGPFDVPTVGRFAVIRDPTGGVLGIATYGTREG